MDRPDRLVVVVGTGTEVGKTWATAGLLRRLRDQGVPVGARKPAQSFEPGTGPTDAEVLAAAAGADPYDVCPRSRWYPVPMAPPAAARRLGLTEPRLDDLVDGIGWDPLPTRRVGIDTSSVGSVRSVGFVETAGGVRSPQAADGDAVALAERMHPDVVLLVADAGLGVVHAVRSALPPLRPWPVALLLNRFATDDPVHVDNLAMLCADQAAEPHDPWWLGTDLDELAAWLRRLAP